MADAYEVRVTYKTVPTRHRNDGPVSRQRESIRLLEFGIPVADFYDIDIAHKCANLLNGKGAV